MAAVKLFIQTLLTLLILLDSTCFACRRQIELPDWPVVRGEGNDVAVLPLMVQMELMIQERQKCVLQLQKKTPRNDSHCPGLWDNVMCWPDAEPGELAYQPCAKYINGFNITRDATRQCLPDGGWALNPDPLKNKTWTNYTGCIVPRDQIPVLPTPDNYSQVITDHLPHIALVSKIGYSTSLISLILAVAIMLYFKKLHCPRNTVHINLFISFILRAGITCLKDYLLVDGLGLQKDIFIYPDGRKEFIEKGSHWECRLLLTVFHYALMGNYFWIFAEALYLHMLIFVSVFSERSRILPYLALGWAAPLLFIIPWVIVRAVEVEENTLCWNTNPNGGYLWILKGPIAATVVVNFIFFLNIVRVLFTKLRASNTPEARRYRYRKLARSTLVLIPLFGVHYIIFLAMPSGVHDTAEIVKLYFEMFFNSFQGFLVALLFCFFNGEVQSEISKKWDRYQLRRNGGSSRSGRCAGNNTTSTYFTRAGRTSMHSIHSTMDTRTEVGNGALGNGNGSSARERMYSRGSVPRTSPDKDRIPGDTDMDVEADICKMEDEAYPLKQTSNSYADSSRISSNGGDAQSEQLLQPLLLENGNDINVIVKEVKT